MQSKSSYTKMKESGVATAILQANAIATEVFETIDCCNKSSTPQKFKDMGVILTVFENFVKEKLGVDPKKEDKEMAKDQRVILDEAMAKYSSTIKLANCDKEIDLWIEEFSLENAPDEFVADKIGNNYFSNDSLKSKGSDDSFEMDVIKGLDM